MQEFSTASLTLFVHFHHSVVQIKNTNNKSAFTVSGVISVSLQLTAGQLDPLLVVQSVTGLNDDCDTLASSRQTLSGPRS